MLTEGTAFLTEELRMITSTAVPEAMQYHGQQYHLHRSPPRCWAHTALLQAGSLGSASFGCPMVVTEDK